MKRQKPWGLIAIILFVLIPICVVLHNLFSALYGESSVLSVIFFFLSLASIAGFIIIMIAFFIFAIRNWERLKKLMNKKR